MFFDAGIGLYQAYQLVIIIIQNITYLLVLVAYQVKYHRIPPKYFNNYAS